MKRFWKWLTGWGRRSAPSVPEAPAITERRLAERRRVERRCMGGPEIDEFQALLDKANRAERLLELYIEGQLRKVGLDPDAD